MRLGPLLAGLAIALLGSGLPARSFADGKDARTVVASVEEARIRSGPGVVLAATLRLPAARRPAPVLVLQSGSGANTRGGFGALEHLLNQAGIATIEFDKRGVGQSTGVFTDTMQDMEADLAATIAWLRTRPDIDGSRIALLGHSQGAAAVPVVADRDGHIAAVIVLAGPVGQRGTMFLEQMRAQLIGSGHAAAPADRVVAATRTWMDGRSRQVAAGETAKARSTVVAAFRDAGFSAAGAEGATKVLDSPQLLSMYNVAPGTALAHLRTPVLAIFGARDEIVGPQTSAAADALADNTKALIVEVPGASHGFGYRRADAPVRENTGGGPWLSLLPKALITSWLKGWLIAPPPGDE